MTVRWFHTLDSTNSEALRKLSELPSGTVLAAWEQTAGRGQRSNRWFSEPGRNLTFSIVLKFGPDALAPLPATRAVWLNELISVAVADFLAGFGLRSEIKWPNDIYVRGRKICGILIENSLAPDATLATSVIGVGINLNQRVFPQLANATSLALERDPATPWELAPTLEQFLAVFEGLLPRLGSPALREAYQARLFRKDTWARYRDLLLDQEFTGILEGVEADARLRIRDEEGRKRFFRFKELSFIL